MVFVATACVAAAGALASVLRTWIEQVFRTRRLNAALEAPSRISERASSERAANWKDDLSIATRAATIQFSLATGDEMPLSEGALRSDRA